MSQLYDGSPPERKRCAAPSPARPIRPGEELHRVLELLDQEAEARAMTRYLLERVRLAEFLHRSGREPFARIQLNGATTRHVARLLSGLVRRIESREGADR